MQSKAKIAELNKLGKYIKKALGSAVVSQAKVNRCDELFLCVQRDKILDVMAFLKDDKDCAFKQLIDICGVDYPDKEVRFEVVYHLLSLSHNNRIRVKIDTDEYVPVDTVATLFPTAVWFEREVWDMFGIFFENNPDLRRILTDYGFDGHPLRKDFPLTGFVETKYDEREGRVVYEPVELMQDFRKFEYTSPWEAMTNVQLPENSKDIKPKFMGGADNV